MFHSSMNMPKTFHCKRSTNVIVEKEEREGYTRLLTEVDAFGTAVITFSGIKGCVQAPDPDERDTGSQVPCNPFCQNRRQFYRSLTSGTSYLNIIDNPPDASYPKPRHSLPRQAKLTIKTNRHRRQAHSLPKSSCCELGCKKR